MIYGVIIAGGRGERFWPRSIRSMPKQLLPLISNRPMIVETVDRIAPLIPSNQIMVVAGQEHEDCLKQILPSEIKLLLEPFGRNTACAIGYGAIQLKSDDIMVVLPADHYIPDKESFLTTLNKAITFAQEGWLVTFGIVPTRAETGYGYIEVGDTLTDGVYKVKNFKEKPNQKQAQRFLHEGKFLWNSGMFVWTRDKILSEIQSHLPDFYGELCKFAASPEASGEANLLDLYNKAPNISIDYAVLEKSHSVAVIKAHFIWDDVGSWNALERVHHADDHGNIKVGLHKGMSTDNCIIVSDSGVIATIGVENLIIVHSGKRVFVCDKHHIGEIKELIRRMGEDETFSAYL
ncbi:MAG: mannose-1-phosphate guanylyltransferase [Candidatus Stahlbacteria bacterium]|nr:mannose-1-phosphate guanylyltransferase [Candidatus Stahlbacteria bacterium]